jgi:putative transposase
MGYTSGMEEVTMPWKETRVYEERMRFISRLGDGDEMTEVCKDFGISRKTGYKILRRYEAEGLAALADRSRRPQHLAKLTGPHVQKLILKAKEKRPGWGAAKLLALLKRDHPDVSFPTRTTVHAILERHGLVTKRRKRTRRYLSGTTLTPSQAPNDLWCADHKGQFRLGDKRLCFPLTITDHASRYILACEALHSTKRLEARPIFREAFQEYGLPSAIRTDNGPPFASSQALFALTRLSVWWMRLGIRHERIEPGRPDQNGRHERMHLTMQREVVPHAAADMLRQQEHFELWREDFNDKRPHEALGMRTPAEVFRPSPKPYVDDPQEPAYEGYDRVARITRCGSLWIPAIEDKVFISMALAQELVALKEEEDDLWRVRFMELDLGYYDAHEAVFRRGDS